ncbi:MAG: hypothetical protein IKN18_01240, partial [Neisseriaceae bacterium]|nr:hypothetical protein [Neisseriaceae bacterium]
MSASLEQLEKQVLALVDRVNKLRLANQGMRDQLARAQQFAAEQLKKQQENQNNDKQTADQTISEEKWQRELEAKDAIIHDLEQSEQRLRERCIALQEQTKNVQSEYESFKNDHEFCQKQISLANSDLKTLRETNQEQEEQLN